MWHTMEGTCLLRWNHLWQNVRLGWSGGCACSGRIVIKRRAYGISYLIEIYFVLNRTSMSTSSCGGWTPSPLKQPRYPPAAPSIAFTSAHQLHPPYDSPSAIEPSPRARFMSALIKHNLDVPGYVGNQKGCFYGTPPAQCEIKAASYLVHIRSSTSAALPGVLVVYVT